MPPRRLSFQEQDEQNGILSIEDLGELTLTGRCARLVTILVNQTTGGEPCKTFEELIEYVWPEDPEAHINSDIARLFFSITRQMRETFGSREAKFWINRRGHGYCLDTDNFIVGPITPEPCDQELVRQWKARLTESESEATRELEVLAYNLMHHLIPDSPPGARLRAFKDLLCGMTALIVLKGIVSPKITQGASGYIRSMPPYPTADNELRLINDCTLWLHRRIVQNKAPQLYDTLYSLCHAAAGYFNYAPRPIDESVYFYRVFGVAALLSGPDGLEDREIIKLEEWLKSTYLQLDPLRRLEYYSLYLELFVEIWRKMQRQDKVDLLLMEAGVESFEAANLAETREELEFAAGLFVRAAECLEQIHKSNTAAMCFMSAADLMTRNQRVSQRAIRHYRKWLDLTPDFYRPGLRQMVGDKVETIRENLSEVEHSPKVIILVNYFDVDFADTLVNPFYEQDLRCDFMAPEKVADLAELTIDYEGIVIVGGIQAVGTRDHLRKYFFTVSPEECPGQERTGATFRELEHNLAHYCCIYLGQVNSKPAVVLAGLTREQTCQAIVHFEGSNLFNQFVDNIRRHGAS